VNALGSGDTNY